MVIKMITIWLISKASPCAAIRGGISKSFLQEKNIIQQ
jgi:hypothetical protein